MAKTNSKKKITFFHNTWEAESFIGEGSYGKVYKSVRIKSKKKEYSAIKNISIKKNKQEIDNLVREGATIEEIEDEVNEALDKCLSEIKLMQELKGSSNIVVIEDYEVLKDKDVLGGEINIRMELLKGLEDYFENHKVTNHDILKLGLDISHALKDCEKVKIIHRDIKPDNIFVNEFGNYKLGDFGIARNLEKTTTGLSQKGTFNYIAPEVYKGDRYNKSVDVYSLGIVLYKYFNYNRLPFYPPYPEKITLDSREDALIRRCNGEIIPKPVNATEEEAKIILKMLEYDPKKRYTDISKLISDLEEVLTKDEREIPFPEVKSKKQISLTTSNSSIRPRKMKKLLLIFTPIFLLLFGIFLGILYYNHHYVMVPNVVGKSSTSAVKKLEKLNLEEKIEYVNVKDEKSIGKVLKQSISKKKIKTGSKITLQVGVSSEKVEVPNFVGLSREDVLKKSEELGIEVSFTEEFSDTFPTGMIVSQMTGKGTKVGKGTVIDVLISKGKEDSSDSSWSDWMESLPNGVSNSSHDIDQKTQYSSRTKETTTSNSDSMNGWTLYDTKVDYHLGDTHAAYSVSENELNNMKNNPVIEVTSSRVTSVYASIVTCYNSTTKACKYSEDCEAGYSSANFLNQTIPNYSNQQPGDIVTFKENCEGRIVGLNKYYSVMYSDKIAVMTYYFYKWNNWSGYSDNYVSASDNREVRTRTMYRYKKK